MMLLRVLRNTGNLRCCNAGLSSIAKSQSTVNQDKYKKQPGEVYEERVSNKQVTDDTHQRDVIDQFDHLHGRLKGYAPLPVKKNYNILAQLIFGNAAEEKRVQRIPRGVYLWGTVGGGTLTYLLLVHSSFQSLF